MDGQKYTGQGRSKKIARIEAAAAALRSFIQFKDGAVLTPLKPAINVDFTSDEHLENGISNIGKDELVAVLEQYLRHAKSKYNTGARLESKCLFYFLFLFYNFYIFISFICHSIQKSLVKLFMQGQIYFTESGSYRRYAL